MQEIEFIYSLESYQRDSGVISDFGEIYLKTGDFCFPEESWTDFGGKAVYIWAEDFIALLEGSRIEAECNFYDGAFLFYITATKERIWEVTFVDEDNNKDFEGKFSVNPIQFSKSLLKALKFMKDIYLKQNNLKSVEYYEERVRELTKAVENSSHR